ncbi:MAG: S8 family serine peptidase [Desulfuromonadales bacterium]|nr:S8 family serine peptidase [Desulfuromonadales bacterium]
MRKLLKPVLVFSLGLLLLPLSIQAAHEDKVGPILQRELSMAGSDETVPVIVRMKDPVAVQSFTAPSRNKGPVRTQARANMIRALKLRAEQSQQSLQYLLNRHGVIKSRQLWMINGVALEATPAQIEEISRLPEVASIVLDQAIELPEALPAQASEPAEPNIVQVNATDLWALGYAGQGVTVAIVDSGVDINHPDLGPRWRGGSNSWFDPNSEHPFTPTDLDGHGTRVTGLLLGGNSSGAYIGVAPDAEWIGVKIFADNGTALNSMIHAGYQWLLDPDGNPDTDDAPDIVNNSWSFEASPNICDAAAREFQADVQALKAAGIAVVFAAGNSGPASSTSTAPANYPESFAVGSVGTSSSTTLISDFSSRGPSACDGTIYPEVVAPGYLVLTSDLTANPNPYIRIAGTSFSTPHASGAMALLLSAFPDTPVITLETALKQSATDLGTIGADNTYGYGLIDALAAFNNLSGQLSIDVTDSISPENDRILAFGSVPPGSSASASIRVRNTGSLPLILGTADVSNVNEPFYLSSDACSGRILPAGETCSIAVQFAPSLLGNFSGSLIVLSNAVGEERVTVTLSGIGNTPPVSPQPLAPASGATGGTTVTFSWLPASDAEGNEVSQFLVYSPHADFAFATIRQVETIPAVVLGAGGLLLGALLAGLARRRYLLTGLVITVLFFALVACGGGGGSGGDDSPTTDNNIDLPADAQSTTVSGLVSGITYYWKMTARDSHGAETQSAVRTILVQ